MPYFTQAYLEFFDCLEVNNNKDWFHRHKEIYNLAVDNPFYVFINDFIQCINKENNAISLTSKQAIFRQNRDMRFAKEFPPYKNFKSALLSEQDKRSKEVPGFYIQIGNKQVVVGGGVYKLNAELRREIMDWDPSGLSQNFREKYREVKLDTHKLSFSYESKLEPSVILSEEFFHLVLDYWRVGQEVNRWLADKSNPA